MASATRPGHSLHALLRRWTAPHPSIDGPEARRVRLAAGLLLVLLPVALLFAALYDLPDVVGGEPIGPSGGEPLLSLGVLAAFIAAYFLVRSTRPRLGILLGVAAPLAVIWLSYAAAPEDGPLILYYTLLPVLLGSLLMRLPWAGGLAIANLAAIAMASLWPSQTAGDTFLGLFLFMLTTTAVALLGTTFMERSVRREETANDRLRHGDELRLQILNTVAHDLASPLTPIAIQLSLLKRAGADPKSVEIMERNIALMKRLIADIKDLSILQAGRLTIHHQSTDLVRLATAAVEVHQDAAAKRDVRLEIHTPQELPLAADPERLTQVLNNLLSNAIKFTPPGGTVRLTVQDTGDQAQIRVTDSGRGLTPDEMGRLWQPFSQVHARKETEERGTGLGLYISKGIVEGHGGSVGVQSDGHGHGSTFSFTLPKAQPAPPAEA